MAAAAMRARWAGADAARRGARPTVGAGGRPRRTAPTSLSRERERRGGFEVRRGVAPFGAQPFPALRRGGLVVRQGLGDTFISRGRDRSRLGRLRSGWIRAGFPREPGGGEEEKEGAGIKEQL